VTKAAHWFVVLSWVLAALFAGCKARKPQSASDTLKLMADYQDGGRYDEAIAVGLDWMKKSPNDSLGNAPFLQEIALLYLAKASKEPARKQDWVKQAILYADKALSTPSDSIAFLRTAAIISESTGDLSSSEACTYYRRSVQELQKLIPSLEQADPRGSRQIAEASLDRVQKKITSAGCK
jgi:hypothetical protein